MNPKTTRHLSRRDALKLGGLALAAGILACKRESEVSETITQAPQASPTTPLDTLTPSPAPVTQTIIPTATKSPAGVPDLILSNGTIYTVDAQNSLVQAVAIKDGLIQAVGSDQEILALGDPSTQVIDLAGRAATPGLIDAHIHFRALGFNNVYYVPYLPPDVRDISSLQRALAETVESNSLSA